jgi:predicted alpha/beta superfamily hydrolase
MTSWQIAALLFAAAQAPSSEESAAAPPAATPAAAARPIVIGSGYDVQSAVLRGRRRINVYLPEHYSEAGRSFAVLYLLDGGEKEDFLHIAALAQITAAYGEGEELIVVGIEGVDRRQDLTSPSSLPSDLKRAPTSGGAAEYRRFLTGELKPWVAAHLRTNGRSALIGESLAGLFVLETLLEAPQSFDDYIAVSPSLWWNGGRLAAEAELDLRKKGIGGHRLWIAFETPPPPADEAAKDRARQDSVEAALRKAAPPDLRWTVVRSPESHASIYHPAAWQALRALYGTPQPR